MSEILSDAIIVVINGERKIMKYFETVFKTQNQIIELYAPIVLQEVAIIKDTVDDLIQLRNIFYNRSQQTIIAIAIRITQSTIFGDDISEPFEYVYEDIQFKPSELFGNKMAIDLHQKARKAKVEILKAVFQDGTVWTSDPKNIVCIQPQHEIEASDEFISSIDENPISPQFYYVENDSCWQCTCGEPNKIDSLRCGKCNRMRKPVKECFNKSNLDIGFSEYQMEKERQKKELEEEKEKSRSLKKTENNVISENTNSYIKNAEENNKPKRKGIYVLISAAIALAAIIIFVVYSGGKKTAKDNVSLFINEMFIPSNEIYSYIENAMLAELGEDYIGETNPDGFLGFLQPGDPTYSYIVECDDEEGIGIKRNETDCPDSIIFYDTTTPEHDIESIAYFVKCFEDDIEYSEIVDFLKARADKLPNKKYKTGTNFTFNGKLYYLISSTAQAELSLVAIYSKNFEYTTIDAKTALAYIFMIDESGQDIIEQLSDEKAKELVEYYRNHERDYYGTIEDLINASETK